MSKKKSDAKLTRQGVRDLNSIKSAPRKKVEIPPDCDHSRMRHHCYRDGKPCGHFVCDGCGLDFDDASEDVSS